MSNTITIKNCKVVNEGQITEKDLIIKNGRFEKIGNDLASEGETIDAAGLFLFPGIIEHPIFREHPETGKKALYVTEAFVKSIKDLDSAESRRILDLLYKQASKEEYIYRHKWSNGDLVVWDNRSVQHYAEHGYGDATRTMHRLTTSGSKPF